MRPAPGAPVSAPIRWEELEDPELQPDRWQVGTLSERFEKTGDLFEPARTLRQELPPL